MTKEFYDGTKLLNLKDINGNIPEIRICTSNRSAGKTTFFNRYAVNQFFKKGKKFCLIYRFNYELDDISNKFFGEINRLFFQGHEMSDKKQARGIYHTLYLDGKCCGYALALNNADQIKKLSHLMADSELMLFDEFQSETNKYCPDEIRKFISVHTSLARGGGKQVKYLPVIMISNPVSLINPYYTELGISNRLHDDTKFLRGDGFVLEQGFVQSASNLQKLSAFNRAFSNNSYTAYSAECVYLNDSKAFIEKPSGTSRYLATLRYNGKEFALREFSEHGIIYCDNKPDSTFRFKISVTTQDHNINYVLLKRNDLFISTMRYFFEKGCFRFQDLSCKEAVLKAISY